MGSSVLARITRASTAGWALLAVLFAALMVLGSQRDSSPATPQERVESVARRLACPTCDGESVSESRGTASQAIRREIQRLVAQGQLTDDEIVTAIDDSYAESLRLTPASTGLESLVWVLPVTFAIASIAGLGWAFRRWRATSSEAFVEQPPNREDAPGTSRTPLPRALVATVLVATLAVVAGVAVARNAGDRRPGQVMTGGSGEASISSLLVEARSLGMGDIENALDIYARVLDQEPDNVEALTYFGWLSVLSATSVQDAEAASQRLESGLVLLRQATVVDESYPDARCFLGISFFRFLDDAQAAAPEIDMCLASNPPAEVAALVEGLAEQIAAELESLSDSNEAVSTEPDSDSPATGVD